MKYECLDEASKASWRPLDRGEWLDVITAGVLVSDVWQDGRRVRVMSCSEHWYVWMYDPHSSKHGCFEISDKARTLSLDRYRHMHVLYSEIDMFSKGDT